MVHTFNPSSWEAEVNGSLNQPDLQSKIQDGQGTTEKPCLENPKQINKYLILFFPFIDLVSVFVFMSQCAYWSEDNFWGGFSPSTKWILGIKFRLNSLRLTCLASYIPVVFHISCFSSVDNLYIDFLKIDLFLFVCVFYLCKTSMCMHSITMLGA